MKFYLFVITLLVSAYSVADSVSLEKCTSEFSIKTLGIVKSTVGLRSVTQLDALPDMCYKLCIEKDELGKGMSLSQISGSIYKAIYHAGIDSFGANHSVLQDWAQKRVPHLLSGQSPADVLTESTSDN
jgi:hypothetical protein